MVRTRALLLVVALVVASAATLASAPPAGAFCSSEVVGAFDCDDDADGHESITVDGLGFLNDGAIDEANDEHSFIDTTAATAANNHFDNCRFRESGENINDQYLDPSVAGAGGVLEELDPSDPSPLDAADEFGQLLHTAQDFYAHSNWVDLGRSDLYDAGLGTWREPNDWSRLVGDIVVGEGEDIPAGWSADPAGRVPLLTTDTGERVKALISGATSFPTGLDDNCHDPITIGHDELNKDEGDRPGHTEARALAVRQTTHEWCRLLHLLQGRYGDAGPSTVFGLWVANGANPNPAGTPCAPAPGTNPSGPIKVTVTSTHIAITEDEDDFGDAEANLRLILWTGDLRRTVTSQSPRIDDVDEEHVIEAGDRPAPVSLCVQPTDVINVSVQGWDDDDDGDGSDGKPGAFDDDGIDDDDPYAGVSRSVGPASGADGATPVGESDNLDAFFHVSATAADGDDDGLTDCEETDVHHTNPADADTDDDGLLDGAEVRTHRTNPLDADSDDDGLLDGDEVTRGTNPLDADSDDDGLTDGDEVTRGTNPLDADSDDDGLTDGDEVNVHRTDPLDPDTDDDLLPDGLEVTVGTDPLDADSDDDGLVDGRDVDFVVLTVEALPLDAFHSPGNRDAFLTQLGVAENRLLDDDVDNAVEKLLQLRGRTDGCGAVPDNGDWIVDCAAQLTVRALLDLLVANLGGP